MEFNAKVNNMVAKIIVGVRTFIIIIIIIIKIVAGVRTTSN